MKQASTDYAHPDPRIDAYIAAFGSDIQERLNAIRAVIRKLLPGSYEDISYKMPAWRLQPGKRPLIFFGVYEKHIGLYAVVQPTDEALAERIKPYNTGRGTLRFDHDQPLPIDLIKEILTDHVKRSQT